MGKSLGYGEITITNMTEPFTVMLTNESQQFATDSNRKVVAAQSYYTDIIVMRGSQERTDYTIGNISSSNGISVSKTATRVTFSVSVGNVISADAGTITIPITLDGQTVNKTFSWSCTKQGIQGVKGNDGDNFSWNMLKYSGDLVNIKVDYNKGYAKTEIVTDSITPSHNVLKFITTSTSSSSGMSGNYIKYFGDKITKGTTYTVSFWAKYSSSNSIFKPNVEFLNLQTKTMQISTEWQQYVFTGVANKDIPLDTIAASSAITFYFTTPPLVGDILYISSPKVEDGDKATPWSPHPDDLIGETGKSVSNVVEYYLATSAGSGVTYSTSGWSADPTTQKLTPTNKYLWNCKITEYDDGTKSQPTTPVICGTYGDTGKNALQSNRNYTGTYTTVGTTATCNTSDFNRTPLVGDVYTCLDGSSNTGTWQVTAISGTTVTIKLLGYVKSKGENGKDGTSVTITSKSVTYQASASGTTTPTGTWQSSVPTVANGQYLWTKTTVQYSDGNKTEAYGVSYKGTNGTSVTVSKNEVTYQVSTSGTTTPTGTWSTSMPSYDKGQYLWTKTYVKYSDGKETTSYSVSYKGVDGNDGADGDSFAWNLLSHSSMVGEEIVCDYIESCNDVTTRKYTDEGYHIVTPTSGNANNGIGIRFGNYKDLGIYDGETITFSCDVKGSSDENIPNIAIHISDNLWYGGNVLATSTKFTPTNNWQRVSVSITTPSNLTNRHIWLAIHGNLQSDLYIKNLKLEKGSTPTPWSPSQSDIEGKGVAQIVQYYLATSAASGVTSSTSGWSTDITTQKITATKKYLWNCSQTKYTDGTSEPITTPTIIGVYGDTGVSTKILTTSYSYNQSDIDKYSKSGYSGTWGVGISTNGLKVGDNVLLKVKNTTKNSDCLIFAQITKLVSEYQVTCTSYGAIDNGADGQDGAGFHWNLISKSDFTGSYIYPTGNNLADHGIWKTSILNGDTYTLSFDAKSTVAGDKIRVHFYNPSNITSVVGSQGQHGNATDGLCEFTLSTTLERYWVTYKIPANGNSVRNIILARMAGQDSAYPCKGTGTITIGKPKLEEGDKASPWCTTYEETLAKSITITPSAQIFKSTDGGNTFAPNQITITPTLQGDITFGKWQYSIDGGVSFVDVVSGQSGLSIDANKKLTVAKTSGLFTSTVTMVTFKAVASDSSFYDTCSIAKLYDVTDIEIGGVNLIKNSNFADGVNLWNPTGITYAVENDSTYGHHFKFSSSVIGDNNHRLFAGTSDNFKHIMNTTYTLSFYAKASANTQVQSNVAAGSNAYNYSLTTSWKRFTFTYKATAEGSLTFWAVEANKDIYLANIKLERGNKATDYTVSPEDVQTAILSTKNSIESVSSKVDTNTKSIEDKVSKTTYETDLKLVKGDLSKANEGLNKWRYEIYPKSLFEEDDRSKYTIDIFATNTNLVPSQTVLLDDGSLSTGWNYGDNHIAYALTFIQMSAKKDVTTKMFNDDGASLYVNGSLIVSRTSEYTNGQQITFTLTQGWNCIEVVLNEGSGSEGFRFSTTLSNLSECQIMNCYYGTPVARQSRITNQLVDVTKNLSGVNGTVQNVMTVLGGSGKFDDFKSQYNTWKDGLTESVHTIGETYVTKDDFDGLEIGGRNLLLYSKEPKKHSDFYGVSWFTSEEGTYNGCSTMTTTSQWGCLTIPFKKHIIDRGLAKVGDVFTYSIYARTNNTDGKYINCSYRFLGNNQAYWFTDWSPQNKITTEWKRYSVTFTITEDMLADDSYMATMGVEVTSEMTSEDKVYFACPKLEKGNKPTDWTPAPEDDEINGQNLVSNLPGNWEQGSFYVDSSYNNKTYPELKCSVTNQIRTKDLVPVSGSVTVSAMTTQNSSKENLGHYIILFDINKKYLGEAYSSVAGWNQTFPRTIDVKDARYMAIVLKWGDGSKTTMQPSDISKICLKIERGTSATQFTLAPEDVNGKINSVESVATQTSEQIGWLINKNGSTASSLQLTQNALTAIAENIDLTGRVTFSSFDNSTRDRVNTVTSGNLITVTPANPKSDYDNQAYNVTSDDKGGRCVQWNSNCLNYLFFNSYTPINFSSSDRLYYDIRVPNWGSTFDTQLTVWFYDKNKNNTTSVTTTLTLKGTTWNHFTGYLTLPAISNWGNSYYYIIGLTNPNKQLIGFTNDSYIEKVNSYATTYAKKAVEWEANYGANAKSAADWVTNNGQKSQNLYSMVSKWTDGAVSDTTQINGGWLKTNTITANKIAIGDFTNYSQLDASSASTWGFDVTSDSDGVWFTAKKVTRDIFVSKPYPCQGGESYLIEYDISTSVKASQNSSDTASYVDSAIGVYGYTGDIGNDRLPTKATNIWYAKRVTGSSDAPITHVQSAVTTSDITKQIRIFLQTNAFYNFNGKIKIRNLSVRKMTTGNLIVDGAITADKINVTDLFSKNIKATGTIEGVTLKGATGEFSGNVTAASGKIGRYDITSTYLMAGSGSTATGMGGNQAFWAGGTDSNSAPFRVGYDGSMVGTKGTIAGWNISSNGLYSNNAVKYNIEQTNAYLSYNSNVPDNIFLGTSGLTTVHREKEDGVCTVNSASITPQGVEIFSSTYDGGSTSNPDNSDSYSIVLRGDRLGFRQYGYNGKSLSETNYTYITPSYARFYGDIFVEGGIGTDGDVDVSGFIRATKGSAVVDIGVDANNNGRIELGGERQFIDFHYGNSSSDYTSRIITESWGLRILGDSSFQGVKINSGNMEATDFKANGYIYNSSGGHYTWQGKTNAYMSCGGANNAHNIYYYSDAHCFYVNGDSGSGMMYIQTNGVTSRVGFTKTSDERIKKNFECFDTDLINTYMNLNPVKYQLKNDDSEKYHFGFKAQDIKRTFSEYGQSYNESFDLCTSRQVNPDKAEKLYGVKGMTEEYALRYDELIAPTTYMVQHTYKELEKVKQEKADLELRLAKLEVKLATLNL